jgi:hypothetical protein
VDRSARFSSPPETGRAVCIFAAAKRFMDISLAMIRALTTVALAAGLFPVSIPARAESTAQFYKGRTITLLIATSPGGLYDLNGRLIARYLGRYIPGKPTVVVQNMPGGSGLNSSQ